MISWDICVVITCSIFAINQDCTLNLPFSNLQFVWEELYKATPACGREVGTLFHLRQSFKLVNVPLDVRKNYASCESLMLSATKSYLCSAFLTWAEITSTKDTPSYIKKKIKEDPSITEQWQFLESCLGKFVDEFVLTEFDIEKKCEEENERKRKEREGERRTGFQGSAQANSKNLFPAGMKVPEYMHQFYNFPCIIKEALYLQVLNPLHPQLQCSAHHLTLFCAVPLASCHVSHLFSSSKRGLISFIISAFENFFQILAKLIVTFFTVLVGELFFRQKYHSSICLAIILFFFKP